MVLSFLTLQTLRREFPECTWEIAVRLRERAARQHISEEGEELEGFFFFFFLSYPKACGTLLSSLTKDQTQALIDSEGVRALTAGLPANSVLGAGVVLL